MSAKLLRTTLICSDIHDESILNVNCDDVEEGFLLVTFCSMVKRYCLSYRKQVNSWTTKSWNPFTSTAIRDPVSHKITVVVSESFIYQWPLDEEKIENVGKQKFKTRIHSLLLSNNKIYIIFVTGFVEPLDKALQSRKEEKPQIIEHDEIIVDKQVILKPHISVLLLRNVTKESLRICIREVDSRNVPQFCNFSHENFSLIGSCIFSSGALISAWSDGNLYSFDCVNMKSGTPSPGFFQGPLSCLKPSVKANLIQISSNLVAIQGMNISDEGGLIILWDTKFGVNVSSKNVKMRDAPFSWPVDSGMVILQGSLLCHIPICTKPSTVASMFGSKALEKSSVSEICCGWSSGNDVDSAGFHTKSMDILSTIYSNKSDSVRDAIRTLPSDSSTEDMIIIQVVKLLIETKATCALSDTLKDFTYIPEGSLVSILKYFTELKDEELSDNFSDSIMVVSIMDDSGGKNIEEVKSPYSQLRQELVNRILVKPFSSKQLGSNIQFLDFTTCWNLIEHLYYLLVSEQTEIIPSNLLIPSMNRTCDWISLLLDAKYHQLVMTSEVKVHKKLLDCLNYVASLKTYLLSGDEIEPLVERILHSKPIPASQENLPYSIERLS